MVSVGALASCLGGKTKLGNKEVNVSDVLGCGLRFMMAIDPKLVDDFFEKVRETIDPCDCRTQVLVRQVDGTSMVFITVIETPVNTRNNK